MNIYLSADHDLSSPNLVRITCNHNFERKWWDRRETSRISPLTTMSKKEDLKLYWTTSFSKLSQIVLEIWRTKQSQNDFWGLKTNRQQVPNGFTHIQLYNPEERDEEEVEGNKETEGAADVGDGLALCRWNQQVWGRERQWCGVRGVQGGDGREAGPELPILSPRHSCCETGDSPWKHTSRPHALHPS